MRERADEAHSENAPRDRADFGEAVADAGTLPRLTPPRHPGEPDADAAIPRVIHRCLTRLDRVPDKMRRACHEAWLELNPEYEMRWNDYATCRQQLADAADDRLIKAWEKLIPATYRADLWRLHALHEHGGVYLDAPFTPRVPLRELFAHCGLRGRHRFIIPRGWAPLSDGRPATRERFLSLHMGFFAVSPRHPFMAAALEQCIRNVEASFYGEHQVAPTGPIMLARAVHAVLGLDGTPEDHMKVGLNDHGDLSYFVLDDLCDPERVSNLREFVLPGMSEPVVVNRYDLEHWSGVRKQLLAGQPRYYELWRQREVYRE